MNTDNNYNENISKGDKIEEISPTKFLKQI